MKRQSLRAFVTIGVVATSLLVASTASAAIDMFLTLDGIKGESKNEKYPDAIDVLAWSWGESNGTARTRHGTLPKVCIQDLNFTKFIDAASPGLIMSSMLGDVIPTATLVVLRRAGEVPTEYVQLTMKNVKVTSYQTGGSGGQDRLTENVSLHFESMQFQYWKPGPTGAVGEPITVDVAGGNATGCR